MDKRKFFGVVVGSFASLLLGIAPAHGADPKDLVTLKGQCSTDTAVLVDDDPVRMNCTDAVLAFYENGNVMVQFAGTNNEGETRILGFAGPMRSKDIVTIERIYLTPGGQPLPPANNVSACAFLRTGSTLMEVKCRSISIAQGSSIETRVRFIVKQ